MIYAIIGGVGSGKSVSAVKKILAYKKVSFANFNIKAEKCTRLLKEHIVKEEIKEVKKSGKAVKELKINWEFWEGIRDKHENFHIFLDEVQNIFHSRKSVSKWNIMGTMWISQIRKILGNSEKTHIFLISQRLARIDVAFRDLLHGVIYCRKIEIPSSSIMTKVWQKGKLVSLIIPAVWIVQYYFLGDDCVERFSGFMFNNDRSYHHRSYFLANPYFEYYDSYEKLGESAYL